MLAWHLCYCKKILGDATYLNKPDDCVHYRSH